VRENALLPPSVLVAELLDQLASAIADRPDDANAVESARRRLVVEHPLHAFSEARFLKGADRRIRSHDQDMAAALRQGLQGLQDLRSADPPQSVQSVQPAQPQPSLEEADDGPEAQPPFFVRPLAPADEPWRTVSLDQLSAFFANPCQYLLTRRLGIHLPWSEAELPDDEPLEADWTTKRSLAERLLPPLVAGRDAASVRRLALAGTELPDGEIGRQVLEVELAAMQRFAALVRRETAGPAIDPVTMDLPLDLDGEPWRLHAALAGVRPEGLVCWRYRRLGPVDRVGAWLQHLVLCAAAPSADIRLRTRLLAADGDVAFAPVADADTVLQSLLRLYRTGLSQPLHFFPKSSWAFVETGRMVDAERMWMTTRFASGESSHAAYRLAFRDAIAAPLDDAFREIAHQVLDPLIAHTEAGPS
jgi:exodeoxyribonuclease V gamma subunit